MTHKFIQLDEGLCISYLCSNHDDLFRFWIAVSVKHAEGTFILDHDFPAWIDPNEGFVHSETQVTWYEDNK